jgi:predicted metalloprotease with PDZ domain
LIPDLVVSFVAPGGPAEKAGLKPGDQIEAKLREAPKC